MAVCDYLQQLQIDLTWNLEEEKRELILFRELKTNLSTITQ